ncbi:hypothetical protein LINPERHAP1_LOCUS27582 [Linum perenne]
MSLPISTWHNRT